MGIFHGLWLLVYQRVSNDFFFWLFSWPWFFGTGYLHMNSNIFKFRPSQVPLVWNFISNFRFGTFFCKWNLPPGDMSEKFKVKGWPKAESTACWGGNVGGWWEHLESWLMYFFVCFKLFFFVWFNCDCDLQIFLQYLWLSLKGIAGVLRYFSVFHFEGKSLEFQGLGRCWLMSSKVLSMSLS